MSGCLQVHPSLADVLTDACVDAVLAIRSGDKPVDLHMVEIMEMQHKTATETTLVRGMYSINIYIVKATKILEF